MHKLCRLCDPNKRLQCKILPLSTLDQTFSSGRTVTIITRSQIAIFKQLLARKGLRVAFLLVRRGTRQVTSDIKSISFMKSMNRRHIASQRCIKSVQDCSVRNFTGGCPLINFSGALLTVWRCRHRSGRRWFFFFSLLFLFVLTLGFMKFQELTYTWSDHLSGRDLITKDNRIRGHYFRSLRVVRSLSRHETFSNLLSTLGAKNYENSYESAKGVALSTWKEYTALNVRITHTLVVLEKWLHSRDRMSCLLNGVQDHTTYSVSPASAPFPLHFDPHPSLS